MRGVSLEQIRADAVWLRRLARAVVRGEGADDAAQETWLARLAHGPDPEGGLRAWLRAVLTNGVRKQRRGEARRRTREAAVVDAAAVADDAETLVLRLEARQLLAELTVALEEPLRTVVLLCYEEGLSPSEIARRQGVPPGTVRWRLKQARDRLRAGLEARHAGRRGWRGLFLPLAAHRPLSWKGMLLMKMTTKVGAAAIVVALVVMGGRALRPGSRTGEAAGSGGAASSASVASSRPERPTAPARGGGGPASAGRTPRVHVPRFTAAPPLAPQEAPRPLGLRLAPERKDAHLHDRRPHPGPEEAREVGRVQTVLGQMKERASACLAQWPVMDPLLAHGVMLKVQLDPAGLQDVSIVGLDTVPDGPLRCLSNAVYELDWSGLVGAGAEATVPLRYDHPDGGSSP